MPTRRPLQWESPGTGYRGPLVRLHRLLTNNPYHIWLWLLVISRGSWSNHQPWVATAARLIPTSCTAEQDMQCNSIGAECIDGSCRQPTTLDAGSAASIACSSGYDCRKRRSATPYCVRGRCAAKCTSSTHCDGPNAKVCAVDGVCRQQQCTSSSQCRAANSANPYCLAGECSKVQCAEDSQCEGAASYCVQGRCRKQQCYKDLHCTVKLGRGYTCNNGSCQAQQQVCVKDVDCSASTSPYCVNSICQQQQCAADADCSNINNGTTPFCVLSEGIKVCQACSTDTQCLESNSADPYCRNICGQNKCIACAQDADCANNNHYTGTACDTAAGTCVQCTTDQHCDYYAVIQGELTCIENRCVVNDNQSEGINATKACTADQQCPKFPYGPAQTCQVDAAGVDGRCRECQTDNDCPPGLNGVNATCSPSGRCVQCSQSSECPSTTWESAVCSAATGKCVECQSDEQCRFRLSPAKPLLCFHGICSFCRTDHDCCGWAGKIGQGPYCDAQGTCNVRGRSCSKDEDCVYDVDSRCKCAYGPCPKPTCNVAEGVCDSGLQGL